MSRSNHARTKEKRKKLRLKAFFKRVWEKRSAKRSREMRKLEKGVTITGNAKLYAMPYEELFPEGGWFPTPGKKYPNQRQKRKQWRQNPHLRNK